MAPVGNQRVRRVDDRLVRRVLDVAQQRLTVQRHQHRRAVAIDDARRRGIQVAHGGFLGLDGAQAALELIQRYVEIPAGRLLGQHRRELGIQVGCAVREPHVGDLQVARVDDAAGLVDDDPRLEPAGAEDGFRFGGRPPGQRGPVAQDIPLQIVDLQGIDGHQAVSDRQCPRPVVLEVNGRGQAAGQQDGEE